VGLWKYSGAVDTRGWWAYGTRKKNSVFIIIAGGLSRLKDIIATITSGFHWYFNCNLTELFYFLRKYR